VPSNVFAEMVWSNVLAPNAVPIISVEHAFGEEGEGDGDVRQSRMGLGSVTALSMAS